MSCFKLIYVSNDRFLVLSRKELSRDHLRTIAGLDLHSWRRNACTWLVPHLCTRRSILLPVREYLVLVVWFSSWVADSHQSRICQSNCFANDRSYAFVLFLLIPSYLALRPLSSSQTKTPLVWLLMVSILLVGAFWLASFEDAFVSFRLTSPSHV